jgi:hypothetical protein
LFTIRLKCGIKVSRKETKDITMIRDSRTQTFTGDTIFKIQVNFYRGYVAHKTFFWSSNDRVPSEDMLTDFFEAGLISAEVLHTSNGYRSEQTKSFLNDYVIAQANRSPEQIAEEQMMARAALGNQPIVDIVTDICF